MSARKFKSLIWPLVLALLGGDLLLAQDEAEASAEEAQEQAAEESAAPDEPEAEIAVEEPLEPLSQFSVPADQQIQPGNGLDEKVSLDLRNIEVSEALRFLATKGGLNLVVSKNVAGRVQLLLNNVPIRDILDIIFITNDLAYEQRGDVYYIMTEAEYKERYGRKFSDPRKVKVFRLKYAIPDQAFALFEILKSEVGRILVDPESGTVLVVDTQESIDQIRRALEGLEQRRTIKVYNLKYAKAVDVEARLKTQLDNKKVGLIVSDERTNSLMVETFPDRMAEIDELVAALDQKTKEVLIDAKIIKVVIADSLDAEIEWEGLFSTVTQYGISYLSNHPFEPLARTGKTAIDNFVAIPPTTAPLATDKNTGTENLFLGFVQPTGDAFETLINLLSTIGETKVLSNPRLAVVNNEEAKILVGEKQAYVTTTTTTGQTTTTTAETVTFIDVGIQLAVTPTINDDGYVTMKIKPEISSVIRFLTTPSGNQIPIVDTSLAETSVMVKDGVSIIIGGLRKDEKIQNHKKVPILGDLPIIGMPFNSHSEETNRTELLILITPHVVGGDTMVTGKERPGSKDPFFSYNDYPSLDDYPVWHQLNDKEGPKVIPVPQ